MEVDFLRRAKIATHAFADIANWRQVLPRAAAGEIVTKIQLRSGSTITALPDNVLWTQFSDIWYHRSYTKHCAMPPGAVVLDVGANVGVFALFAARVARIVYSLEPASLNFPRLVSNVSRAKNILPLNLACSGRDGRASLNLGVDAVSFSLVSQSPDKEETVDVVSLGTLFERYKIDRCDFLKLDCEGAEFEIILDADPSLMSRVDRIVMEYHDHLSKKFTHRDLLQKLEQLGFRAKAYNPNGTYGMIAATRQEVAPPGSR
jgi:FkbM family methyltransferase